MVGQVVAIDEHAALVRQRLPVAAEGLLQVFDEFAGLGVPGVIHQGRVVADLRPAVLQIDELGEIVLRAAMRRLANVGPGLLAERFFRQVIEQFIDINSLVPDIDRRHPRKPGHLQSVAAGAGQRRVARLPALELVVAAGDDEARGEPLDIPFPGSRQGLVEIVHVENQMPFRRRENAEVHQVTISAELHS